MLSGRLVSLRPLEETDLERLAEMLGHPDVARWWGEHDADRLRRDYLAEGSATGFAIVAEGRTVGLVSYWEQDDPEYRHAGIDVSVAVEDQGRGYGGDAVRTLARHLFAERGHWRVTIDPDAENERAIAVYERIGFRPVGVMRRYERRPDGSFRDALLMDLLPEDLGAP